MAYDKSVPDAPVVIAPDWRNVGQEWILALSLNTGLSSANSSTARQLARFIPGVPSSGDVKLDPLLPSIAETLAVMAGNTLLLSSMDTSFYHFWNYEDHILTPGVYEQFNASVSSQQYASGMTQSWQGIFYIVLVPVFLTNLCCLTYFFVRHGLVTDWSEPQNLFALAVNSPPSDRLSGACGAGPVGDQLNVDWHIAQEDSGHLFIKEGDSGLKGDGFEMRSRPTSSLSVPSRYSTLSVHSSYHKLSNRRDSWL